jgi:hypothetical protein
MFMRPLLRSAFGILLVAFATSEVTLAEIHVHDFAVDPGWDGYRNRLLPESRPRTRQDFGFRKSNRAGGAAAGEIGGRVQRALTPASYAKAISQRTLNDRLLASGRFAVTAAEGGSGILFGWFHESSRGWRTPNSLAFRFDGNGGKCWVFFEYGTSRLRTGGGETFEGRYQTTTTKPMPADGKSHEWSLSHDPNGGGGDGEIVFTLDGARHTARLLPGHKADGATFNRFGIWNQQCFGDAMEIWFDDLVIDGVREEFATDPGWIGVGNDIEFTESAIRPLHDFGYSTTNHAGGALGEIGGLIWRDEAPAYYGDKLAPLTLRDELHASGRLALTGAGSDSAVYLGWFDAASKSGKKTSDYKEEQRNILAILIEGPSRAGHYFRPGYRTADGSGGTKEDGPVIFPDGRVHKWALDYYPTRADGRGQITVQFDGTTQTFDLRAGDRDRGATFDRFGLFNIQAGGHHVQLFVDDLRYTSSPAE